MPGSTKTYARSELVISSQDYFAVVYPGWTRAPTPPPILVLDSLLLLHGWRRPFGDSVLPRGAGTDCSQVWEPPTDVDNPPRWSLKWSVHPRRTRATIYWDAHKPKLRIAMNATTKEDILEWFDRHIL